MIRRHLILALFSGVLLAACGGSPTAVAVTPTPTPRPTPTPVPNLAGCNLPPMPDLRNECPRLEAKLTGLVDVAQKRAFAENPELFDFDDRKGDGLYSYKVHDQRKYTGTIVKYIQEQGGCAVDQLEEIAVKVSQDYNEQWNIWTSDGYVRTPPGAYITTCFPAQF